LVLGLSTKADGAMNSNFFENRNRFLKKLKISPKNLILAQLVHQSKISIVFKKDRGEVIPGVDGLLTKSKNTFLGITVADCLPVFLFDLENKAVGLIHCGWRGLVRNILSKAVAKMIREFKTNPENILAGIGPGICQNHFEVKSDVYNKFKKYGAALMFKGKRVFLDLKKIARIQLINSGLKSHNIEVSPVCTYSCKNKYFSYRRDKKLLVQLAIIGYLQ